MFVVLVVPWLATPPNVKCEGHRYKRAVRELDNRTHLLFAFNGELHAWGDPQPRVLRHLRFAFGVLPMVEPACDARTGYGRESHWVGGGLQTERVTTTLEATNAKGSNATEWRELTEREVFGSELAFAPCTPLGFASHMVLTHRSPQRPAVCG